MSQSQSSPKFSILTLIFAVLFLLTAGYLVYSLMWGKTAQLSSQVEQLKAISETQQMKLDSVMAVNDILMEHSESMEGTFYEVQIGAFEHFDLDKYMEDFAKLRGLMHDGLNKYTIARFRSKAKADRFMKDMKKIGVSDAFVAKYVDGERTKVF